MLGQMRAIAEYAAANPGTGTWSASSCPEFRTRAHEDFFQVLGWRWPHAGALGLQRRPRPATQLTAAVGVATYHDLVLPDGHRGRAVSQTFSRCEPDDPRRLLTVVVAEEVENLDQLENRIHHLLLVIAVATAVAMLLIAHYAVLRGLRPVASFARSAGGRGSGGSGGAPRNRAAAQ